MNIEGLGLQTVRYGTPVLSHQGSRQSIAASEDYLTASDHESVASTIKRYSTPLGMARDESSRQALREEDEREQAQPQPSTSQGVRFDDRKHSIPRKPVSMSTTTGTRPSGSSSTWLQQTGHAYQPSITPGVDDSPYYQFAIEQLSRDLEITEDLRNIENSEQFNNPASSRPISGLTDLNLAPLISRGDSRPVSAMTSDDRTPILDPRHQRSFEPAPETFAEAVGATALASKALPPHPTDGSLPPQTAPPTAPLPDRPTTSRSNVAPHRPKPSWRDSTPGRRASNESNRQVVAPAVLGTLKPVQPQSDDSRYSSLQAVPAPLRLPNIVALCFFVAFIIAALTASSVHSAKNGGLNVYDGTGTSLYFVYEFLPQIFAAITIAWIQVVQNAAQRILPFTTLAKQRVRRRDYILYKIPLFMTNWLWPNLSPFNTGNPLLGLSNIIFWLNLFSIPLMSCVYQSQLVSSVDGTATWFWAVTQPVAWTLIPLYFLVLISIIVTYLHFNISPTGLQWDPRSIADIFFLLRRANRSTLNNFRPISLGYWESDSQPGLYTYGIGQERLPIGEGEVNEKRQVRAVPTIESIHSRARYDELTGSKDNLNQRSAFSFEERYGWIPWFLQDRFILLWLATALVLMIAFIVVSFVHNGVERGFDPLLPSATTSLGFSSANFLYSFLPSLLGMFLYVLWQPIDMYYRALQPFAELASSSGATAQRSLLLDYTAQGPLFVTLSALRRGHIKVALFSFMSLIALTIPVLAGGVFTALYVPATGDVDIIATSSGYIALLVFVIIYAFAFTPLWPQHKRCLPHDISSVPDIWDFVRGSNMLEAPVWRDVKGQAMGGGYLDLRSEFLSRFKESGEGRFTGEKGLGRPRKWKFGVETAASGTKPRMGVFEC